MVMSLFRKWGLGSMAITDADNPMAPCGSNLGYLVLLILRFEIMMQICLASPPSQEL